MSGPVRAAPDEGETMELDLRTGNIQEMLKAGDKGYNGDTEGAYRVSAVGTRFVSMRHTETDDLLRIEHAEAREQDWRWFRD